MMAAPDWQAINQGLYSQYIPDPHAEVGHCVHHIAMHAKRPDVLLHAETLGRDAQRQSRRIVAGSGRKPAKDFGFVVDVHAHEPETIYVVPIKAIRCIIHPMESCGFIAAVPVGMTGNR